MAKNVRRANKSKMAMESVEVEAVGQEDEDVIQHNPKIGSSQLRKLKP